MTDTTPTNTAVGDLVPPRIRALVYLLTVMLAAAYVVAEANVALHWGWVAGYAAWNAGAAALAVSNTAKAPS